MSRNEAVMITSPARSAVPVAAPATTPAPPPSPTRRSDEHAAVPRFAPRTVLGGLAPLLLIAALGAPYYTLPLAARLRSPYHEWLKPSGWIGQSAGLLAFALFAFLWLYPIRKRLHAATFLGPVPRWLDAHIVAGILMPVAGAVHAGFRFGGLIGLGYFAMLVVAGSGFVGRYLYVRIPRSRAGLELSREQASAERRELLGTLVESTGLDPRRIMDLLRPVAISGKESVPATLVRMVRDDLDRRRAIRRLARELGGSHTPGDRARLRLIRTLAWQEMALAQQVRLLDATNRLFRMWHAFHMPFAITAFLAVTVHVTVAILFGATWLSR